MNSHIKHFLDTHTEKEAVKILDRLLEKYESLEYNDRYYTRGKEPDRLLGRVIFESAKSVLQEYIYSDPIENNINPPGIKWGSYLFGSTGEITKEPEEIITGTGSPFPIDFPISNQGVRENPIPGWLRKYEKLPGPKKEQLLAKISKIPDLHYSRKFYVFPWEKKYANLRYAVNSYFLREVVVEKKKTPEIYYIPGTNYIFRQKNNWNLSIDYFDRFLRVKKYLQTHTTEEVVAVLRRIISKYESLEYVNRYCTRGREPDRFFWRVISEFLDSPEALKGCKIKNPVQISPTTWSWEHFLITPYQVTETSNPGLAILDSSSQWPLDFPIGPKGFKEDPLPGWLKKFENFPMWKKNKFLQCLAKNHLPGILEITGKYPNLNQAIQEYIKINVLKKEIPEKYYIPGTTYMIIRDITYEVKFIE